jgi:hypothetical protein
LASRTQRFAYSSVSLGLGWFIVVRAIDLRLRQRLAGSNLAKVGVEGSNPFVV